MVEDLAVGAPQHLDIYLDLVDLEVLVLVQMRLL